MMSLPFVFPIAFLHFTEAEPVALNNILIQILSESRQVQ